MTESSFKTSSSNYQDPEKEKKSIFNSKMVPKSELKSSIPKPSPYMRKKGPFSIQTQSVCRIPRAKLLTTRGRTSISLQSRPYSKDEVGPRSKQTGARSQSPRPKETIRKNPYSNVKAKVDTKLRSQFRPATVHSVNSNVSSDVSSKIHHYEESESEQPDGSNSEELIEKQRQLLTIFNELKKAQPTRDLQPLEREIFHLMRKKTTGSAEGSLFHQKSPLLSEGVASEFLSSFESQTQELFSSWLRLICDIISTKMIVGNSTLSRMALPDPSLNLREEVLRYLSSLPSEGCNLHPSINSGEPLHMKLQRIEEEQMKAMTKVMHSVLAQTKELEDLKDKCFRLEKTQDQIHFEMKEQMAILSDENKELDRKYSLAVEKYNLEKSKVEQQDKQKLFINKETIEVKKMIKVMEGKCLEYEAKVKKAEAAVRNIETTVRNKDVTSELEAKQHRELVGRFNELKETVNRQKSELAEINMHVTSVETENKYLQSELSSTKVTLDESVKKRNELIEELSNKTKKLNETEVQLEMMKSYMASGQLNKDLKAQMEDSVVKTDLSADIRRKELEIEELRRQIISLEHVLKEKTTVEDHLRKQVMDLNRQPNETEIMLKAQLRDLQYAMKDVEDENSKLEQIIAQKTLELDQRDLLFQQHSHILKSRDELIPMLQSKKRFNQESIERLRGFLFEKETTYFEGMNGGYKNNDQGIFEAIRHLDRLNSFDPQMVDKEMTFRQEKMTELYNQLELKQMEIMRLERRMRDLQSAQALQQEEQASHKSSFQKTQGGQNSSKSRGLFSMLSGQDYFNF